MNISPYIPIYNNPNAGTIQSYAEPDYAKYGVKKESDGSFTKIEPVRLDEVSDSFPSHKEIVDFGTRPDDELPYESSGSLVSQMEGTISFPIFIPNEEVKGVPEPASLLLFAIGISGLIRKLKR